MAEVKKDSSLLSWAEGKALVSPKSLKDFDSKGDYYTPKVGGKFIVKNPLVRKMDIKNEKGEEMGFPIAECYEGNKYMGYMPIKKLQGRSYTGIKISKAGKPYASFEVKNEFCKNDTITLGVESLIKIVEGGKKFTCTDMQVEQIPAFGTDLTAQEIPMVDSKVLYLKAEA
jgi:hypothetical protein